MCGIFGGHPALLLDTVEKLIAHRGPDQQGRTTLTDRAGRPFALGMTRLSIVDRREIPTPFSARGAWISFNGEIYNWREIRRTLEGRGVQFVTQTDTEVALQAYLEWGPACLERFNGMFAFAVFRDGELFLARDRLGKKPLFFYSDPDGFAFASEIKAFARLEHTQIDICERLEFYFNEYTPFRSVKSVRPGEWLLYDSARDHFRTGTWWRFPEYQGTVNDEEAALREFLPLFEDACKIRRIADVPITLFLSGGIDSALIQAVLKFDHTYTVQFVEFADIINEADLVREYAAFLNFEAHVITPSREDFLEALPCLARHIEYPVGSFSVFPLFCLARMARRDGFKAALSGEGADEFFNGYYRNEMLLEEDGFAAPYVSGPYQSLACRYFGSSLERFCRMASRGGPRDVETLVQFLQPLWNVAAPLAYNISVVEASIFLQPLLVMADRMSMANSLEVRNPFLDHRIIEFSTRLVPDLRYRNGRGKYLLRQALKRLLGTTYLGILRREVKHGLPAPVNEWLLGRHSLERKDWNHMLLGECLRQFGLRGV